MPWGGIRDAGRGCDCGRASKGREDDLCGGRTSGAHRVLDAADVRRRLGLRRKLWFVEVIAGGRRAIPRRWRGRKIPTERGAGFCGGEEN